MQFTKQIQHLLGGPGIEGAGGFIGQQQAGLVDDRPGHGHPLLLAARELVGLVVEPLGQTNPLQGCDRPLAPLLGRDAGVDHRQDHVVEGAHLRQQVELLEDKAQLPVAQIGQGVIGEILHGRAIEVITAAGGAIEAPEDIHRRALARARGAHHRQILTPLHPQAEVVERNHGRIADAIDLADVAQFSNAIVQGRPSSRGWHWPG